MRRANAGRNVCVIAQDRRQKHIWSASDIKLQCPPYCINGEHVVSVLESADSNAQDIFIHTTAAGDPCKLASRAHINIAHIEAAALNRATRAGFIDILVPLAAANKPDAVLLAIDTTAANEEQIQAFLALGAGLQIPALLIPEAGQGDSNATVLYRAIFNMRHLL